MEWNWYYTIIVIVGVILILAGFTTPPQDHGKS
jgi:hypothetical protein